MPPRFPLSRPLPLKGARVLIGMTALSLISRALGMLRTILTASALGTGSEASAFALACRIPLTLYDLLFSSFLGAALVPTLASLRNDPRRQLSFFRSALTRLLSLALILTLSAMASVPLFLSIVWKSMEDADPDKLCRLILLLLPILPLCLLTYLTTSLLEARGRFLAAALIGCLPGAAFALVFLLLSLSGIGISASTLSLALLFSWICPTLFLPSILGKELLPPSRPSRSRYCETGILLSSALPAIGSGLLLPLSRLLVTALASADRMGARFDYAFSLCLIAASLSGGSLIAYLTPRLSSDQAMRPQTLAVARRGSLLCLAVSLPVALLLLLFPHRILSLLYQRGAFTPADVSAVAAYLSPCALFLPLHTLSSWLVRADLALGYRKTPLLGALCGGAICLLVLLLPHPSSHVLSILLSHTVMTLLCALPLFGRQKTRTDRFSP